MLGRFVDPSSSGSDQRAEGGIVDVVQDLKEKAEEDLNTLRKAETNDRHNYEMLKQSLEDQVAADMKDMDETKSGRAASEETKATAEGEQCTRGQKRTLYRQCIRPGTSSIKCAFVCECDGNAVETLYQ